MKKQFPDFYFLRYDRFWTQITLKICKKKANYYPPKDTQCSETNAKSIFCDLQPLKYSRFPLLPYIRHCSHSYNRAWNLGREKNCQFRSGFFHFLRRTVLEPQVIYHCSLDFTQSVCHPLSPQAAKVLINEVLYEILGVVNICNTRA